MNKRLWFFFCLCAVFGCRTSNSLHQGAAGSTNPPGTVKVGENFYCDRTEVANLGWAEYMYWTYRVYGDSLEYQRILPDTSEWTKTAPCLLSNEYNYSGGYIYLHFPVVGVTQVQAFAYSKWRSDRVFERILINQKKIAVDTQQIGDDHFTIERYFNGEWRGIKPDPSVYYPEYRLPSLKERSRILHYADSVNSAYFAHCRSSFCKECAAVFPGYRADVIPCVGNTMNGDPTRPVDQSCDARSKWSILNLRGNVGEWSSVPGVTLGGGWHDSTARIMETDTFHVATTNAWTGFRNVCQWKRWEK